MCLLKYQVNFSLKNTMQSTNILDKVNDDITQVLQALCPISDDYLTLSMRELGFIANSCLDTIAKSFHDKYRIYSVASMARLLIEIVSIMVYLKQHPAQAEKYWRNQEEIQKKMKAAKSDKDRWQMYVTGKINFVGMLESKTNQRIKDTLGGEILGQYNFLNFYSHPNIAGYKYLIADPASLPGTIMRFTVSIYIGIINHFIIELSGINNIKIEEKQLLKSIKDAHKAYCHEVGIK